MDLKHESPDAVAAARGAHGFARGRRRHSSSRYRSAEVVTARVVPDGAAATVRGREAQTLHLLIKKGAAGFTSGEASPLGWARRTSHYIMKLRRAGFPIGMVREETPDGSRVGRYFLLAAVEILDGAAQ